MLTWAASSEKVFSSMRKMRRFRSSCGSAKYYPSLCSPFINTIVSNDSVCGQVRPWSDCADAQSDLRLRCSQMSEDTFSNRAAHITKAWPCITKTRLFKFIEIFTTKNWKFSVKNSDIFFYISAQNIDCEYSLEPPCWVNLCKPQFYYIKVGFNGVKII